MAFSAEEKETLHRPRIWRKYEEIADGARYTPKYIDLHKCRKETIERVFADAKKHAMRYTNYRGLASVTNWVKLKLAAMNLKKFALSKWRRDHTNPAPPAFSNLISFLTSTSCYFMPLIKRRTQLFA